MIVFLKKKIEPCSKFEAGLACHEIEEINLNKMIKGEKGNVAVMFDTGI